MAWLCNLRVRTRLLGAFGIVLLLAVIVGGVGIWALGGATSSYQGVLEEEAEQSRELAELNGLVFIQAAAIREHVMTGRPQALATFREHRDEYDALIAVLNRKGDPDLTADLRSMARDHDLFTAAAERAAKAVAAGDAAGAAGALGAAAAPLDRVHETAGRLAEDEKRDLVGETAAARSAAARARWIIIGVLVGVVLLAALLALAIARSVVGPLARLREATAKAADGDLTAEVGSSARDETGQVSRAYDDMIGQMRDVVGRVVAAAGTQSAAAREMAAAAEESGSAVGQIAATIDSVAAGSSDQSQSAQAALDAVQEIVGEADQVAEASAEAADLARGADEAAGAGADTAHEAEAAMGRVAEGSEQIAQAIEALSAKSAAIGEIVGTITEIAGQTNLLALNAAIEAARAGDAGRGFAVVADEVRKLAEEANASAGTIAGIVRDIQAETERAVRAVEDGRREVEAGGERVDAAGRAFGQIGEQVTRLAVQVERVAQAGGRLRAGTAVVQDRTTEIAGVSQENAASAEEVAATTEETSSAAEEVAAAAASVAETAEELERLVARFRVA
ncbi:MAG: methyl-accepting chemotaxis protein [Thermoleophilia bacterium]|jgi:methyl-accepting chemotaxis protein|nr:methyl-accepting chemotaxis protein [Thermoleophilia bacterium]